MSFIQTYTGRRLDLVAPHPDQIDIEDIAHALAIQARFNGHTREPYSVAQHSVLVSHLVPPEHAFEGLMHDSPEFGVGDVVSPLKRQLAGFSLIEARVWRAIAEKYRLPFDGYGMVVELWDLAMCRAEAEVLLPHRLEWVDKLPDKPEATKALRDTGIWDWRMAKDQFLRRFRELQEARAA